MQLNGLECGWWWHSHWTILIQLHICKSDFWVKDVNCILWDWPRKKKQSSLLVCVSEQHLKWCSGKSRFHNLLFWRNNHLFCSFFCSFFTALFPMFNVPLLPFMPFLLPVSTFLWQRILLSYTPTSVSPLFLCLGSPIYLLFPAPWFPFSATAGFVPTAIPPTQLSKGRSTQNYLPLQRYTALQIAVAPKYNHNTSWATYTQYRSNDPKKYTFSKVAELSSLRPNVGRNTYNLWQIKVINMPWEFRTLRYKDWGQ